VLDLRDWSIILSHSIGFGIPRTGANHEFKLAIEEGTSMHGEALF
jgi:hypothetical protein